MRIVLSEKIYGKKYLLIIKLLILRIGSGVKVISKGYKIIYEPKASVFHWHGVHQDLDPIRASNVVGIIENLDSELYKYDPQKIEDLNIAAIIPIKGKT